MREEQPAMVGAGDPLHQDRHLLVVGIQAAVDAVLQGVGAHRGGVHGAYRILQGVQPLGGGALVGAEDRFVFAGEGIAEVVLQQGTGSHNDRGLAEMLQHTEEPFAHRRREPPGGQLAIQRGTRGEIAAWAFLLDPQLPPAVGDDEGIEQVGAQEIGIVPFQLAGEAPLGIVLENRPGHQHPHRFAADVTGADLPSGHGE